MMVRLGIWFWFWTTSGIFGKGKMEEESNKYFILQTN
jgi:hypothetical protein